MVSSTKFKVGTKFTVGPGGVCFGTGNSDDEEQDGALKLIGITNPAGTPASGSVYIWWNDTTKRLGTIDSGGIVRLVSPGNSVDEVTFAASTTIDCRNGNYHRISAMTADMTSFTFSNAETGSTHFIEFLQNGTGGWNVTPHANFISSTDYALNISTTADARTIWEVIIMATNEWRLMNRQTFTAPV